MVAAVLDLSLVYPFGILVASQPTERRVNDDGFGFWVAIRSSLQESNAFA